MTSTHNVTRNISYFPRTICTMTSFYYYDQNPSGFCFLVQIIFIGLLLFKPHWDYQINMRGKTKRIMVVVVK